MTASHSFDAFLANLAEWILATLDLGQDLFGYRVRRLGRKVPLPYDAIDEGCYAFDPLEPDEYSGLLVEADALADVLGAGASDPMARDGQSTTAWIVSDTGHEKFGTDVPFMVLGSSATFV